MGLGRCGGNKVHVCYEPFAEDLFRKMLCRRNYCGIDVRQPEQDRCRQIVTLKLTLPCSQQPRGSNLLSHWFNPQLRVLAAFVARVKYTDSTICPVEAKVQTLRATAIVVICVRHKYGLRMRNAWTNDCSVL